MAITRYDPNTIWLGGPGTIVNDIVASEAITPGHLIERHNDAGTAKYRKHAAAGGKTAPIFAMDQSMLNKGVDDAYASGDLVEALVGVPGTTAWAILASGQTIVAGQQLESAGDGTLRAIGSGEPIAAAVVGVTTTGAVGRAKVEVL